MSAPTPTSPPQRQSQSVFTAVIGLPFKLFGVLMGALLLSILLEWAGQAWVWPEQHWHHAREMLNEDLLHLSSDFTRSAIVQEPEHTAHTLVNQMHQWLVVETGLADKIQNASSQPRTAIANPVPDFRHFISVAYRYLENYLLSAAYRVQVFMVRLLVVSLSLPLFLLAAFVGLVDGLVRRDLRRFGAGRESGFIYHRARASLTPLMLLPCTGYLVLPFSVPAMWVLLPGACLLGVAVNITAGSFKKYL
ncbi:TIGR03747 family integrating conjugative element membrane protein [Lelliottia amnigena]|uniref:TIGR03747 family integrating conjugative element membrane protein n=1 Tax=Lelliottia amnigena TaxID=61646 RepID=UPI004056FF4B